MKKRNLIIILIICLLIICILTFTILLPSYKKFQAKKEYEKEQERIRNATIIIDLKEDLSVPFLNDVKVSDFITAINGEVVLDYNIDTSEVGEKEVNFEYINEENIKIPYSYKINIIDDIPPEIWLGSSYTVYTDYNGNLLEDITCADNYDDNPKCEIIGDYDTSKIGSYKLTFQATDASNNVTTQNFTLNVKERTTGTTSPPATPTYTYLKDVIEKYKKDNTKIGIDVSSWQGNINFEKVKNAGIEFVFIRVGSTRGIDGEYFIDNKFIQNIEGFNNVGIPVGIYFYSYAKNKDVAINDANWVLEQISDYKVDLPVVYDWENWSFYNEFKQSYYSTTKNAKAFMDTVKKAGYNGALYSSKNYLERVWYNTDYPVWLAHYTSGMNISSYKGEYKYWQICSNGIVDGINGNVDIDVMFE